MSIAIGHFVVGAALTTIVVTLFVPNVRYPRTIVLAGGGWAMVPDFHQVSPIARETLYEFHQSSPLTDLFWFHRTLDTLDTTDSNAIAALLLAAFIVTTVVAERRSYRVPTAVADTYETYLDVEARE